MCGEKHPVPLFELGLHNSRINSLKGEKVPRCLGLP